MVAAVAVKEFYERRRALVWTLALLAPVAVVAAGVAVAPETFWDRFIWEDIWGPIWVDAHQCGNTAQCAPPGGNPGGIVAKDGYTVTSELTYGLVLAASLYVIFTGIFRKFAIRTDGAWVAALIPYILLGPTARTLEDADVFLGANGDPGVFAYVFISPIIYIHIAVYTVAFLLVGVAVERARGSVSWKALTAMVAAILATMTAAYAFIGRAYASGFSAFAPAWVFALAALAALAYFAHYAFRSRAGLNVTLFALGLPLTVPPLYLIGGWLAGGVWSERAFNGDLHPTAGAIVLALAATVVAAVAGAAFLWRRFGKGATAALYLGGLNLALVFGHMLDGFATWVALLDPFKLGLPRYAEKHPFSDFLLTLGTGTPFQGLGFPVAKLTMILVVIWLLDREFKNESAADQQLAGLIKMAIFVLGFAPGTRDLLRLTMGV